MSAHYFDDLVLFSFPFLFFLFRDLFFIIITIFFFFAKRNKKFRTSALWCPTKATEDIIIEKRERGNKNIEIYFFPHSGICKFP